MLREIVVAAACISVSVSAGQAQMLDHLSVALGYGRQSSYQHPRFITAEVGYRFGGGWTIAPTARRATGTGGVGWRVQLSLQRHFGAGWLAPYVGAGPSWTSEVGERNWSGSEFGAMLLLGANLRLFQSPTGPVLSAFLEGDGYTHHYATGQLVAGLRLRFRP